MDNARLKQNLRKEYSEDMFACGAYALRRTLEAADIASFTKENLDTVFAFIDSPAHGGDFDMENLLKRSTLHSLYCTENLKTINKSLPEFAVLDPQRARENTEKSALFVEIMNDARWEYLAEKWVDSADIDKKRILRRMINRLRDGAELDVKVRFASLKDAFGQFDTEKNTIYLNTRGPVLELQGLQGCALSFAHEANHAELWQAADKKPINKLFFFYFVEPYASLAAYKRNYLELDARDIQSKMFAALLCSKQNDGR